MTHNMKVTFTKRNAPDVELSGTYYDDGLSSLTAVTLDDGSSEFLSVLDNVVSRERISEDRGEYFLAGSSDERWTRN